ncbi:MAG: tRNA pseudouridine(38-40) synthase TruA [Gemmatimonadota bacterium]|nr:tRNA pseudouridine(38-40) synthase TruA [Gemmatimonadota bacterium]
MSENSDNLTRFRATIQYDGTDFHGSQVQPEVRTVQGELETALSRLLDRPTRVDLAGRTDTGVHATAQEIAFDAPPSWHSSDLRRGLTALLPPDVEVGDPRQRPDGFHPRFDADRRRYVYAVAPGTAGESPFLRRYAWRTDARGGLLLGEVERSVERLSALAALIPGQRDFSGFAKAGQPERGVECGVESATWRTDAGGRLLFEIVANRFLHHMVRYLVGTMVEIAAARRDETDMAAILAVETPSRPVFPAPPGGLYLAGVRYPDGWNREAEAPW